MLKSIKCDKFRTKEKEIVFTSSLNIIKGDENATNSIGKSTILMLIDFVMGGSDFLKHNKDVVDELGHHSYFITFEFSGINYYFRRDTKNEKNIFPCDDSFCITDTWDIESYCKFLLKKYNLEHLGLTFRGLVSLFIRVWNRTNLEVKQPLHTFPKEKHVNIVNFLLKLFLQYQDIEIVFQEFKKIESDKKSLNEAFKSNVVEKIRKTEYKKNTQIINDVDNQIETIRNQLALHAFNINQLLNNDLLELKNEKDILLRERQRLKAKIYRVRKSIKESKYFESSEYNSLLEYFPNINKNKIDEVESFHRQISNILIKDVKLAEKDLTKKLENIQTEIQEVDRNINLKLSDFSIDIPKVIVNKVLSLSQEKIKSERQNSFYDEAISLKNSAKIKNEAYKKKRDAKLLEIGTFINDKLRLLTNDIYDENRKSPSLDFLSGSYSYDLFRDTGTGKAYRSLVLFDLAIFGLTDIPFIAHDSLLFKNIENDAVLPMLETYCKFDKQSFISIDDIKKYGDKAVKIIEANKVLELSDSETLYIKDWR